MSAPLTIEERKRLLEERRRALEERKQVVASLTQVEEESIKTEEAVEVSAKKRELDERKRALLEKKNALLAKRQTEDEEIRKQEAEEQEKKKNLQIEEKKREFEERKRRLEEKKKQLEEQRKKEDEQLRALEIEEEKKIQAKKLEIEDRRKALEDKKKQLAEKRKEEEQRQKDMEETLAAQNVPTIDIEQKRAELQEKKRRLDEKKKQLEEIREKEAREKKEAEELEQKKLQLEARKKALEQRKKQLEDQRSASSDKLVAAKQPEPVLITPPMITATEKPDEVVPTPAQIQNQNQSLAELEAKKRELERRKKDLEDRRKQQSEAPLSPQVPREQKEPAAASTSSSNLLDDKKRELEEKKRELERRKKALEDAKREDEERQHEQKRREQALEFEKRKQDLDERRRQMEEKKRILQEEKEQAMKEAQQRALEEQEEINRKKQDLEERRKQIQDRKRLLDEIRRKEEEEGLREKQQEEELQRKKAELDQKKRLLEEKRRQLEAEKLREKQEQEEMEALEKKKKELEERKERLRQKKKDLDDVKQKEKEEDKQVAAKQTEAPKAAVPVLQAPPQLVVPSTAEPKEDKKDAAASSASNQNPLSASPTPTPEENEEAVEQEIQRKKTEIEERKRRIEEKKKQLELQRQKEEEEKRQREEEENKAQEEQEQIQSKRREIEQRRKDLEDRKRALEQLRQEEEKKIIVLEGEQQQLAQLEEISAIQLKKVQLEDRKRILEDRKKALEERRQTEKQEQLDIEKKAREEELRQKQEEEQLEKRRRDLEERRRKLNEKKQQLRDVQSAEVAQNSEDVLPPPNEDAELDAKKLELEERKKRLAERRKQLQELKSLNAASTNENENQELTMIEQTKAEIENTQIELESKLQTLEAKQTVQLNTNEDMLASLSSKERQLLNLLTPDQQKALEQLAPSPHRTKSNTISSKKKPSESLGYDAKAFLAEQERLKQMEKENAKKFKKQQKELEKEREKREREDKERQKKEQKEQEKIKKQKEKELSKTKPVEAVYVPKTELSEAEKMFLASMAPTDRTSFLTATPPEKPASQSGGTIGKSVRKKTSSKGSFIMPDPSVFVGTENSASEFEDSPKLMKQGSFALDPNSAASSPGGTVRGIVLPGLNASSGNITGATLRSTPLHEAVRNGDKELFKNLLQMEDVNVRDTQGQTPLHVAAFKGSFEMVTFIVSELSDVLAGKKVELNLQDNNGWTPLHAAAFNASAKNGTLDHLKICKFMLEQEGINPHLLSKDSSTAAHFFFRVTCSNKPEWEALYTDVIDLLAKKNVDFNIQNNKGETCLHQAAFRGNFEGVQFLVDLTENLTVLSLSGVSVAQQQHAPEPAKEKSKMPGVFKNLFTPPSAQGKQLQRSPSAMQPLALTTLPSQNRKVNLNTQNQVGETAVHCAAKAGHTDIVRFLVANWADVNIKSEQGYPKDVALSFNQSEIAKFLDDVSRKESQTALSPALWFKIFSYLSGRDICRCAVVCKFFRRISDNDAIWKELCIGRRIASVINPKCKTKHGFSKIWKKDYIMVKNLRLNPEKTDKLAKSPQLVKAQAIARGWVARTRYAKLKKMRAHRDQIAKELVDTEQTYVDNLKILVKAFLTPLRNTANTQSENPIITKQQIKVLFSDIEIIQNTNNNLLQKLRSRLDSWSNAQKIGDIFVSMTDTFKLYTQYINNFDRALLTLEECMKNPAFAEFIKPREAALKSTINSLMILPIQRPPRYNLLLTELVKNTWPEHVDYTNLKTALQKMQSIAVLLNEKKREAENKEKITAIQNAIEPSAGLLYAKSRRFVMEGEFIETIGKGQKIPLYIFLFSDMIIMCRPQKKRTIPPKYKLISQEKLFTVDVQEEFSKEAESTIGSNQLLQSFVLNTMTGEKLITAQKKEIRDNWVNEIKNCIAKSKKSRKVGEEVESTEQDLALLEQNINNEDLKPEAKIKILEAALQATRKQLQDEKRMKEQLTLTKQNLEMQVKQAMSLLTKETKEKLDALAEVRVLKEQVFSLQSSANPHNAELDAISKMALEGLTEEQKEWLSHLAADEKQDRIDLVRLSNKKDLKKLGVSRTKTLRGKEKDEKKKEKEDKKEEKEKKTETQKLNTRASFSSDSHPPGSIHLQELVKQGNKSGIQHALSKGNAALNSQDSEGLTALHLAASESHLEILKMLLEDSKIDVNIQDINGWTPLHSAAYAASKNPTMDSLKICETLLHNPALKADITNNNLNTALHLFVKVPCSGSKLDDYKNLYETVISLFLEKTDPNIQNQKGETCLHSAVFAANQQVIERLLGGQTHKLSRKKTERKFTISFSSGNSAAAAKEQSHERRVDFNITSDDNETPLAVAAKLGDVTIITSFVKHFADFTTRAKLGTAVDIAKFFQHTKAAEIIENTIKAEKTKLPPTMWYKIFQYVAGHDTVSKSMQSVHVVCKEFRRLSGRVKTESTKAARDKHRENATAMSSIMSRQRAATIQNNAGKGESSHAPENENWKIAKQNLELQLKQAVTLLTEETKKRQAAEKRVKELEVELKAANNPEQIQKLEEQLKKQRLAYDNMQQQFVMNLDKITTLEKQVKQLKAEKLEENTKYEERVYFMEKQAKEKRDEVAKHYEGQMRELSRTKSQLEEANKNLKATIKELSSRAQQGSAAPPIPDRPGQKRASVPDSDSETEKEKRPAKPAPAAPAAPEKSRRPPAPPAAVQEESYSLSSNAIPTSLVHQAQKQPSNSPRIIHDFWEGSSKLIVSVDVPGVDLDLLDFHITRFTLQISRKVGVFEEKYFGNKYKPVALQRFGQNQLNQVVKEQIILPCAVLPNKKQAYYFNGTVYLQLEKLSESSASIEDSDWQKKPVF